MLPVVLVSPPARLPARASRLDTLAALTLSDLRARYGRGQARLVKWLLDPFALVGVFLLLVVFRPRPARHRAGM